VLFPYLAIDENMPHFPFHIIPMAIFPAYIHVKRMANVLAGAYPDVFKAASVYSGVPDGCFAVAGSTPTQDPPGWSNNCANGQVTKTAAQWGDLVRGYYPGYTGPRTRMQM